MRIGEQRATCSLPAVQDPILTELGMQQSRAFDQATENTVQARAELVVTSCVSAFRVMKALAKPADATCNADYATRLS